MGFGVMKDFPGLNCTYISGIAKRKEAPSGIIEEIVKTHVAQGFETVVVRTQNDRVVEIMTKICDVVYPIHSKSGDRELGILREMGLGRSSSGLDVGYDLIARKHYGGAPMIDSDIRQRSTNSLVRRTTDRLNYHDGDAMLLVGYRGGR
jgi:hypothetical protein